MTKLINLTDQVVFATLRGLGFYKSFAPGEMAYVDDDVAEHLLLQKFNLTKIEENEETEEPEPTQLSVEEEIKPPLVKPKRTYSKKKTKA